MIDWQPSSLAELIDIKHGFAFKGQHFVDYQTNDVLVTPGNFAIGGGFKSDKLKYYDGPVPDEYVLQPGDLIVTMTDLSKQADTLGYSAIVPKDGPRLLHNQRIGLVTSKDKAISLDFLGWLMRTPAYRNCVVGSATGSTVKHTSPTRIKEFEFLLPPENEQNSISATLNALDHKIELNRRMNETLEAQARALFRDWFVDFGPVKAKMAGDTPYLAPDLWSLFPDRLGDAGVPEGWKFSPLTEHFEIIGGGTPKTSIADYWNGPIPWFSVVDTPSACDVFVFRTEKTITQEGIENSSARIVRAGTTIISARGTVGNRAIAAQDLTFNQSCYALQGLSGASDEFVYLAAGHMVDRLKSMAHGSVFSTITRKTFEGLSLAQPNEALHEAFRTIVSPLFSKIRANVAESHTLAQTRDLLLPKLMSGEIRVGEVSSKKLSAA
ncbi:restriction endonuclease subunit S [Alteriqipengyuania flavescens]|uniref:restriction endonuclease subunit S n=1 Tax=Alteriqipengyuania flavescens TaxID=3053610 RepID=UPI0025B37264|nr:restriction endonuclease subunit S [Alteriqipengyuania flavescens]WJY19923.1 restriction endonuclease subunit S [Alteriqipengyuania flavescens]WJY25868.1 restriction endonuclease subunit S [Alteriqipengyuania flavescens]